MKISLVLFTATAMYFLTACNNGSDTSTANKDSSTVTSNSAPEQTSTPKDTAKSGNDLMKPMDECFKQKLGYCIFDRHYNKVITIYVVVVLTVLNSLTLTNYQ